MAWSYSALRIWLTLMMVAIGTQFFFAAAGAFGATTYDTHKTIGSLLVLAGLVALLLSLAARSLIPPLAVGLVLLIVQALLGHDGFDHPWLGAVHGLNALGIGAVYGSTTGRAWQASRTRPVTP
jgi:hypothetical protein